MLSAIAPGMMWSSPGEKEMADVIWPILVAKDQG